MGRSRIQWIKKGASSFWNGPEKRKEGYEERCLGRLFLQVGYKALVGFTLLNKFTLSPADFHVDFLATFSFVADEITHILALPFRPGRPSTFLIDRSI